MVLLQIGNYPSITDFQDHILLQADWPPPALPGPELSDPRHDGGDPERGAGHPGPDHG